MSEAPWKKHIQNCSQETIGPCPSNQAAGSRKGLHELVNFGIAFQDSLLAEVKVVLDPELIGRNIRLKQLHINAHNIYIYNDIYIYILILYT